MANFTVKNPPEYNDEMRMLEPTDPAHANIFNPLIAQLLNNDAFLKLAAEKLAQKVADHIDDETSHVTDQNKKTWNAKAGTEAATPSTAGLMSAADKTKLNGIDSGAQKITQVDNWRQGTDLPSTYPKGESIFFSNSPANRFNNIQYCTVHTIKGYSAAPCIQFLYPYNTNADKIYFREAILGSDAWRPWQEVITSANIGSQSVSYATTAGSATTATKAIQDGNGKAIASTYLPLTGGNLSGNLSIGSNRYILFNVSPGDGGAGIRIKCRDNYFGIYATTVSANSTVKDFMVISANVSDWAGQLHLGENNFYVSNDGEFSRYCLQPWVNGRFCLGAPNGLFDTLYLRTGTIQTSDREKKKEIKEFTEDFVKAFIMGLIPVSYMYKQNSSGRTHYGLIAQDVENLMDRLEMDSKDFAGFIKSPKYETTTEEIEVENEVIGEDGKKKIVKEKRYDTKSVLVENEYEYALRYEEFISPIIKMLQILNNRLDSQQTEIEKLKQEIKTK